MTSDTFRKIALSFVDVVESQHMRHPDFRVGGRIFATLDSPREGWGMVKLTPEQQATFLSASSDTFQPASGAWGRQGCTHVRLKSVKRAVLITALETAYQNAVEQGSSRGGRARPKPTSKVRKTTNSRKSPLERVRTICLSFPNTKETPTWGKPHFRVGEKIFAGFDDGTGTPVVGCKLEMDHAAKLVKMPGYQPASYVGKKGWVSIDLTVVTDWDDVRELITESYGLISGCVEASPRRNTNRGRPK